VESDHAAIWSRGHLFYHYLFYDIGNKFYMERKDMYAIEVNNLVKEYKVVKKEKGLHGAVKNLFHQEVKFVRAVDDISFQIEKGDIVPNRWRDG